MERPSLAFPTPDAVRFMQRQARIEARRTARLTGVEFADACSVAQLAVWIAEQRFDPNRARFGTFALCRIRMDLLEYVRRETGNRRVGFAQRKRPVSLDAPPDNPEEDPMRDLVPDGVPTPEEQVVESLGHEPLRSAVNRLPERERFIIVQYYWGDRRLQDLAAEMQVTASRVSQLHNQGLERLRLGLG